MLLTGTTRSASRKRDAMSEKIKEARIKAGFTQKEVCELLNIPPRTLQDWEAGRRNPPAWAEALVLEKLIATDAAKGDRKNERKISDVH